MEILHKGRVERQILNCMQVLMHTCVYHCQDTELNLIQETGTASADKSLTKTS